MGTRASACLLPGCPWLAGGVCKGRSVGPAPTVGTPTVDLASFLENMAVVSREVSWDRSGGVASFWGRAVGGIDSACSQTFCLLEPMKARPNSDRRSPICQKLAGVRMDVQDSCSYILGNQLDPTSK